MSKYKSFGAAKNNGISYFGSYCEGCFEKQRIIDQQADYITSLRAMLEYREQKDCQPFFGSATPSSKLPVKENSLEENRKRRGGAKRRHKGNGRKKIMEEEADQIIEKLVEEPHCPSCGGELKQKDTILRSVVDCKINF